MRLLKPSSLLLAFLVIISSCDGLLEEENEQEGKFTFWSNFDGPPIDIYVDNSFYGTIQAFYATNPGCDASGSVTVTLNAGSYNFEAVEQANNGGVPREWSGTIEVKQGVCSTLGLSP